MNSVGALLYGQGRRRMLRARRDGLSKPALTRNTRFAVKFWRGSSDGEHVGEKDSLISTVRIGYPYAT